MPLASRILDSTSSFAAFVAIASLVGCGGGAGDASHSAAPAASQVAAPPSAAPAPSASASAQPSEARSTLLGRWVSPSCGERKYERQLSFEAESRFASLELVSPCPPGARCVWSGIVDRAGKIERKETTLFLVPDASGGKLPGAPFPATVTIAGATIKIDAPADQLGLVRDN